MIDILLDTNVIIYFVHGLAQGKPLFDALQTERVNFGISVVSETELLAKLQLDPQEQIAIEECVDQLAKVEVNSYIARVAASYRRTHQVALADAFIAATAKYLDLPLWTYNIKDFKKLPGILAITPTITSV